MEIVFALLAMYVGMAWSLTRLGEVQIYVCSPSDKSLIDVNEAKIFKAFISLFLWPYYLGQVIINLSWKKGLMALGIYAFCLIVFSSEYARLQNISFWKSIFSLLFITFLWFIVICILGWVRNYWQIARG